VQILTYDNIDLGCSLIRKAVIEKAIEEVNQDSTIIGSLERRKLAREQKEMYVDEAYIKTIN